MKLSLSISTLQRNCEIIVGERLRPEFSNNAIGVGLASVLPDWELEWIVFPPGEEVKTREAKSWLEDRLFAKYCNRESCIIAVGGGALLDLVGFVAATYCRGIPYISVPTTLLAMTDAAIGGKTGINLPQAKNYLGAFHLPERVYIDVDFLKTLPREEFISGLAETVKHALIADKDLFSYLEEHLEEILQGSVLEMIEQSCRVKLRLVEEDPFEQRGKRALLNFGHTVGHAVEVLSNYSIKHGQAVAFGMRVESRLSHVMGFLSERGLMRIETLLDRLGYVQTVSYSTEEMIRGMASDKKSRSGVVHFVALTDIGEAILVPLSFEDFKQCYAPLSKSLVQI